MRRTPYTAKSVERAHHWIAKAIDTLAEARALIPSGQTRLGAYGRLYYSTRHTAVALLRLIRSRATATRQSYRNLRSNGSSNGLSRYAMGRS